MSSKLNPYINFRGEAREAIAFYQSVFGGSPTISTFAAFGMPMANPAENEWVMHGQLETPSGYTLMISDAPSHMPHTPGSNISISLSGDDDAELSGYWSKLAEGARFVAAELAVAPWGDKFGMLTDRFGIGWMVNIALPKAG